MHGWMDNIYVYVYINKLHVLHVICTFAFRALASSISVIGVRLLHHVACPLTKHYNKLLWMHP
jgi:hypothetical protein